MNTQETKRIIDASPTKEFFISIFIKDIDLKRSIVDLVDNCVDGAERIRPNEDYSGLSIDIMVNPDMFEITDNCGGMSVETAANYAFRFGRSEDAPPTPYSVGLFGVGMKRAIFKMGREFRVESTTQNSYFEMEEDIEEWKKKKDENGKEVWEFDFEDIKDDEGFHVEAQGTKISVTSLFDSVAEDFESQTFISGLADEIQEAHLYNIQRGLKITLNGSPLNAKPIELSYSDEILPAYKERQLFNNTVHVRIFTGIKLGDIDDETEEERKADPNEAGWYIFCNRRLVLGADTSFVTGWGSSGIPKFHNDHARFRGYVFFESADPKLLPWNTTKTGVDTDSPSFRAVRNDMIIMMKPVINFLRDYRKEKSNDNLDDRPLETALKSTKAVSLNEINITATTVVFTYPTPSKARKSNTRTIQYQKSIEQINRVQEELGVSTLKEVGEKTFDYFWERECED